MRKFLNIIFRKHLNQNNSLVWEYGACFDAIIEEMEYSLRASEAERLKLVLSDCVNKAVLVAGVAGMELAISMIDGNDENGGAN